ncbi:MAG: cation:dicarboxylase symporter family transporter, partial [Pseudomonadota bacterium]
MVFLYFILGVVLGVLIPEYVEFLCYFDIVFLRLLNLIIPYMMFPMIVISVSHIMFNIEKDKYLLSVIAYYMVGTLFSILLGFSVAYYYELGLDMDLEDFNISSRDVPQYSFLDILIKIIPENLIAIIYDNNFISLFIVSYLFGIYITYSKYYSFIINVMQKLY